MSDPYGEIPSSSPIIIVAQLYAKAGHADAVQKLLSDIQSHSLSSAEPGCQEYRTVRSAAVDSAGVTKFVVFEQYKDKDAVNAHLATSQFAALKTKGPEALSAHPTIQYFNEFKA